MKVFMLGDYLCGGCGSVMFGRDGHAEAKLAAQEGRAMRVRLRCMAHHCEMNGKNVEVLEHGHDAVEVKDE